MNRAQKRSYLCFEADVFPIPMPHIESVAKPIREAAHEGLL